jgi:L-threonylcarbamoyladenylate synthase
METDLDRAADALRAGRAVVYPTETVYGLGADATDAEAVEQVFESKGRSRDNPLSVAFPDVETALSTVAATDYAERFAREFLPGPVTVVVASGSAFPDVLTAGGDRVGIRVPDHDLSRTLARRADTPITATSANRSGEGSVRQATQLSPEITENVAAVIDRGETPGGESTVVDPEQDVIHRAGPQAAAIREWLAAER